MVNPRDVADNAEEEEARKYFTDFLKSIRKMFTSCDKKGIQICDYWLLALGYCYCPLFSLHVCSKDFNVQYVYLNVLLKNNAFHIVYTLCMFCKELN